MQGSAMPSQMKPAHGHSLPQPTVPNKDSISSGTKG